MNKIEERQQAGAVFHSRTKYEQAGTMNCLNLLSVHSSKALGVAIALFGVWSAILQGPGMAATIEVNDTGSRPSIVLKGPITSGDDERFSRAAANLEGADVILDSPGGLAQEGLRIGGVISRRGFNTVVAKNAMCASACGFIWMAGKQKAIQTGGAVGFHAVYFADEQHSVSSSGNALVGAYLSRLGFSDIVIVYVTEAAPREMRWLTAADASFLGIKVAWGAPNEDSNSTVALTRDDIRTALLENEVERARLRRFPEDFERGVDAILEAQKAGGEWGKAYYNAMQNNDLGFSQRQRIFSEASDEILWEYSLTEIEIAQRLLVVDPYFCAATSGLSKISATYEDVKRMESREDEKLRELMKLNTSFEDKALLEPPVRKPLTKRQQADLVRSVNRIAGNVGAEFTPSERASLLHPKSRKDFVAVCKMRIRFLERLMKDRNLTVLFARNMMLWE